MSQQQAAGGRPDNSNEGLWALLAFALLIVGGWFLLHEQIVGAIFLFRLYVSGQILQFVSADVVEQMEWMRSVRFEQVEFDQFVANGEVFGQYMRFPAAAVCLAMGGYLFLKHPGGKFRRSMDMTRLAESEKDLWPCIYPVLNFVDEKGSRSFYLSGAKLREGRWAISKTPKEWAIEHDLYDYHTKIDEESGLEKRWRTINKTKAEAKLIEQLGPKFRGFDVLPEWMRALLGCFMAKACGEDDKVYRAALNALSISSVEVGVRENDPEKVLDVTKYDAAPGLALFEKYKDHKVVTKIVSKHAYVTTVMVALLASARDAGVVASAEFIWLKPTHRLWWYMFNTLGRRVSFIECAGVFGHYVSEKAYNKPIHRPYVKNAVFGLEEYLVGFIDNLDEED